MLWSECEREQETAGVLDCVYGNSEYVQTMYQVRMLMCGLVVCMCVNYILFHYMSPICSPTQYSGSEFPLVTLSLVCSMPRANFEPEL